MNRRILTWVGAGVVFVITWALAGAFAQNSSLATLSATLTSLWLVISAVIAFWLLWRRLTYRVSVRLLLSYVLIGVSPFLFCALFGGFVLYLLMGQYTSVRLGTEFDAVAHALERDCERVLETCRDTGFEGAAALLERLSHRAYPPVPEVMWVARLGGEVLADGPARELPDLGWIGENMSGTVVRKTGARYVLSAVSDPAGSDMVAALIPLDADAARAISEQMWFDVYFMSLRDADLDGGQREGERWVTISAGVSLGGPV